MELGSGTTGRSLWFPGSGLGFSVMARNIRTLLGRRFNQIRREEEVYATMKATVDCKGKCGKDGWEGKKKAKGRGPNAMMDFGRARYDKAEAVLG